MLLSISFSSWSEKRLKEFNELPKPMAMAPHFSTLAWKIPWTEGWWAVVHEVAKSQTRLSNFTYLLIELLSLCRMEKEMASHSSTLTWKIPWMEEPGRLQSMGSTEGLHFHFFFHALEKEMATHSSILTWKIPWMEEPGELQSMGSLRVGHN